jgi:probable O-glycosylation ligase (exosortase A-associated)
MVVGVSLGALAFKGAIFGIATGGNFRVFGTPDSYISDNNDFALALNMALGILFFTRRDTTNKWARLVFLVLFLSSVLCVILSYSRGGLLGLIAVSALLAVKAKRKLLSIAILAVVGIGLISFAPAAWESRMNNLAEGHLDDSAGMRLASWAFAWNLASHYPLTGAGFECFTPEQFQVYATRRMPGDAPASGPHSIYFQVLAEQGFIGFFLFYLLVALCAYRAHALRKRALRDPRLTALIPYTHMIEMGLAGYVVSGAFLGRAYFDLYFFLVAATIITTVIAKRLASQPMHAEKQSDELEESADVLVTRGREA